MGGGWGVRSTYLNLHTRLSTYLQSINPATYKTLNLHTRHKPDRKLYFKPTSHHGHVFHRPTRWPTDHLVRSLLISPSGRLNQIYSYLRISSLSHISENYKFNHIVVNCDQEDNFLICPIIANLTIRPLSPIEYFLFEINSFDRNSLTTSSASKPSSWPPYWARLITRLGMTK